MSIAPIIHQSRGIFYVPPTVSVASDTGIRMERINQPGAMYSGMGNQGPIGMAMAPPMNFYPREAATSRPMSYQQPAPGGYAFPPNSFNP
jgi:hypothetical protein